MQLKVKQSKISFFGRRYTITKDGRNLFIIRRLILTAIPKYVIENYNTGKKIGTFKNKFLSFKASAVIRIDKNQYSFVQKSFTSSEFQCQQHQNGDDLFQIKSHEGFQYSIWENNQQIGLCKKNNWQILDGDVYDIDLNFDADVALLAAMIVLVDNYRFSIKIGGDISLDVGNFGKNLLKPDTTWLPKDEK